MIRRVVSFALVLCACGGGSSSSQTAEVADPDQGHTLGERPTDRRGGVYPGQEDEDDDGMQVVGLEGRMDTYDIERGIEPHAGAIDQCFQRHTRRKGYIGGKVVLEFEITRDGELESVQIAESQLGSRDIERCLVEVGRKMTFAKPKGGKADFTVPFEWRASRPVRWKTEEVAETEVADRLSELEPCAEREGATEPSNVWVTLYVGARGEVQSVGFARPGDEPLDEVWTECAVEVIEGWTLTDPRGTIAKLGFRYKPE